MITVTIELSAGYSYLANDLAARLNEGIKASGSKLQLLNIVGEADKDGRKVFITFADPSSVKGK